MGLGLAIKAFFKALKEPEKAKDFIEGRESMKQQESLDQSHLRLLAILQRSGRFIDFLKEDIASFTDAQVGSAVRKIHQDCGKLIEEMVTIRPLRTEEEGSMVQVPKGYDPSEIKIVGNVKGEPPFTGKLIHRGWKVHKRSLPKKTGEMNVDVICPAEIEVK